VTLKFLTESWNRFFFSVESPLPVCLFRIFYGLMVLTTIMLLRPDWLNWYGKHAWIGLPTVQRMEPGTRLNLFTVLPQNDAWIQALFWVFAVSAVFLTLGFLTRLSSVLVFLCLASIDQRNLYILHGGDTFLRVAGFFLMFAPAGAALSVDRLLRVWRGKEGLAIVPVRPWAQRMLQFELSLLYFAAFCWKIEGASWVNGTALYYVHHLDELRRFPIPSVLLHPAAIKLETWATLALEFSLGILIWIKEFRYYILAAGVVLHLFIEMSLNIPLFEWDVLCGYILFVNAADLSRVWRWFGSLVRANTDRPLTVLYDDQIAGSRQPANLLKILDVFGRLSFINIRAAKFQNADAIKLTKGIRILSRGRPLAGVEGSYALAKWVPFLWPLRLPIGVLKLRDARRSSRIQHSRKAGAGAVSD
jgi:hypothetical protein